MVAFGNRRRLADDDNGMTSADAQAFKRACSCFGLGRYFYDFPAIWFDLDQNRQPVRTPVAGDRGRSGTSPSELLVSNDAFVGLMAIRPEPVTPVLSVPTKFRYAQV